jgi:hypothetical protein
MNSGLGGLRRVLVTQRRGHRQGDHLRRREVRMRDAHKTPLPLADRSHADYAGGRPAKVLEDSQGLRAKSGAEGAFPRP